MVDYLHKRETTTPVIPAQAGIQGLSVLFNMQLRPHINPNVLGFPRARE
jgi:hypothetical protein